MSMHLTTPTPDFTPSSTSPGRSPQPDQMSTSDPGLDWWKKRPGCFAWPPLNYELVNIKWKETNSIGPPGNALCARLPVQACSKSNPSTWHNITQTLLNVSKFFEILMVQSYHDIMIFMKYNICIIILLELCELCQVVCHLLLLTGSSVNFRSRLGHWAMLIQEAENTWHMICFSVKVHLLPKEHLLTTMTSQFYAWYSQTFQMDLILSIYPIYILSILYLFYILSHLLAETHMLPCLSRMSQTILCLTLLKVSKLLQLSILEMTYTSWL